MDQDTTSCTDEENWFNPRSKQSKKIIKQYFTDNRRRSQQDLACVDAFSVSGNIAAAFRINGEPSRSYDIKLNKKHDILSLIGFLTLCDLGMRLRPGGLIKAGPPCSLFVFQSSSLHSRRDGNEHGDTTIKSVRMANAIVLNFLAFVDAVITYITGPIYFIVEQPVSSWMFKMPECRRFLQRHGAQRIRTYMGAFGHALQKPSFLYGNLPHMNMLIKPVPSKNKHNGEKQGFYKAVAQGKVEGTNKLAGAAEYTPQYCKEIFRAWQRSEKFRIKDLF